MGIFDTLKRHASALFKAGTRKPEGLTSRIPGPPPGTAGITTIAGSTVTTDPTPAHRPVVRGPGPDDGPAAPPSNLPSSMPRDPRGF